MPSIAVCSECGGNCDPECGRHPLGCLYGGVTSGEWAHLLAEQTNQGTAYRVVSGPSPRCELKHLDVARMKARDSLRGMDVGVRAGRNR